MRFLFYFIIIFALFSQTSCERQGRKSDFCKSLELLENLVKTNT